MHKSRAGDAASSRLTKAEQVLDAARGLFIERGFGATNMDTLATAAGVSKATIYAYYGNKEALFAATVRRECRRAVPRIAIDDKLAEHKSLAGALSYIGRAYLNTLTSPEIAGLSRMVVAESTRFPELGQIYYDSAPGLILADVSCYLGHAWRQGLIIDCDTHRAADQFLGMLRGDLHVRVLLGRYPNPATYDSLVADTIATFTARYAAPSSRG